MNAAVSPQTHSDLLFVHDAKTPQRWLIDGGATLSIVPPTAEQRLKGPVESSLQAANGTKISCYGHVQQEVSLGDRVYDFNMVVADVTQPILGSDFLASSYLAPNHRDKCLIDLNDLTVIDAEAAPNDAALRVNFVSEIDNPFTRLLDDKYAHLTVPSFEPVEPKHGVFHRIPTTGRPVQSKARRLAPDKLAVAQKEFEKLCQLGICRRAKSEWASPLLVVNKADGGHRVCGDYRRLNTQTDDDKYPVRTLTDFNANLAGRNIFSKIDLLKGYHQIPVHPDDVDKTAVITPFGLFVFPRTPFGLKNAGQDFQRMMDAILGDLPFCFVYLDDVLVFSHSPEEHLEHLEVIFKILSDNGLVVNRPKCVLGQTSLEFLGYGVDEHGVTPLEDRVQAIKEIAPPTTVKELQRFLGMINYYRRFVPQAAQHLYYLFEALKGKPKSLKWTKDCDASFVAIKEALAASVMLRHPRPDAPLAITSDASELAMGAVIEQRGPDGWEPLSFFSAKLLPNQQLWPPFDRELLAAFRSIRHFRHMVEGRCFTLYTDHQSLVPALSKKTDPQTARQTYQLAGIAEYTTDIRHLEGKANSVADALSRPNLSVPDPTISSIRFSEVLAPNHSASTRLPQAWRSSSTRDGTPINRPNSTSAQPNATLGDGTPNNRPNATSAQPDATLGDGTPNNRPNATPSAPMNQPVPTSKTEDLVAVIASVEPLGLDLKAMAQDQPLDADFTRLSNNVRSGLSFRRVDLGNATIIVDVSNGPARPFVPFSWRKRVFDAIHSLGHPGIERTRQIVTAKFVWPSLRADVSRWARECVACQRAKVGRNVVPDIGNFEVPKRRFEHLHADISMVPTSNGYSYLLTIVDRFTRWPTALPLRDITTEFVIDAFAHGWFSSFGVSAHITTDRGTQFTSAVWAQLLRIWGISHHPTTAYHPQANGLVERFHRRLKESLKALCRDEREKWYWRLPCSLLSIRTALKPDLGASPADLVYGEGLALPGELLGKHSDEDQYLQRQREAQLSNLRLEVERLQPTATSAHRTPVVYLPDALATATHVFVRRGGVHPPLTAPYEGPYRVESRSPEGFNVYLPGRGVERIALARLKPAHVSVEDGTNAQDLDEEIPPPPGRRPGPRTYQPEPTDRITRQQSNRRSSSTPAPGVQSAPSSPPTAPSNASPHCAADPPQAERPTPPTVFRPPPTTLRRPPPRRAQTRQPKPTPMLNAQTTRTSRQRRRMQNIDEYNTLPRPSADQDDEPHSPPLSPPASSRPGLSFDDHLNNATRDCPTPRPERAPSPTPAFPPETFDDHLSVRTHRPRPNISAISAMLKHHLTST